MNSLKGLPHMCFYKNSPNASGKSLRGTPLNNYLCLFETLFGQLFPTFLSILFIYLSHIQPDEEFDLCDDSN